MRLARAYGQVSRKSQAPPIGYSVYALQSVLYARRCLSVHADKHVLKKLHQVRNCIHLTKLDVVLAISMPCLHWLVTFCRRSPGL